MKAFATKMTLALGFVMVAAGTAQAGHDNPYEIVRQMERKAHTLHYILHKEARYNRNLLYFDDRAHELEECAQEVAERMYFSSYHCQLKRKLQFMIDKIHWLEEEIEDSCSRQINPYLKRDLLRQVAILDSYAHDLEEAFECCHWRPVRVERVIIRDPGHGHHHGGWDNGWRRDRGNVGVRVGVHDGNVRGSIRIGDFSFRVR